MNEGGNSNNCDDYESWEDLCTDEPDGKTDTNSKFSMMVSDIHAKAKQNEIAIRKENQRLVEESDIEISKDLFDSAEPKSSVNQQSQQVSSTQIKNPIKKPKRFIPEPKPKPVETKKKNKKRSDSDDETLLYDQQDFQANDYYDKYDR